MATLKLHGEKIEDILINLSNQLYLTKLRTSGTKFHLPGGEHARH